MVGKWRRDGGRVELDIVDDDMASEFGADDEFKDDEDEDMDDSIVSIDALAEDEDRDDEEDDE